MALWQDIRYAVRLLIKDRWFTAVAAIALALGIGANAAVFTFVNAVLLRGRPWEHPSRRLDNAVLGPHGRKHGGGGRGCLGSRGAARPDADLELLQGVGVSVADQGKEGE